MQLYFRSALDVGRIILLRRAKLGGLRQALTPRSFSATQLIFLARFTTNTVTDTTALTTPATTKAAHPIALPPSGLAVFNLPIQLARTTGLLSIIIYGVFANGVQSLCPATTLSLIINLTKTGARTGMVFSTANIACLTGPPLTGVLIQKKNGHFLYAQIFGGAVLLAGILTLPGAPVAKTDTDFKQRV
ncbi:MAG: hypothetical protein M1830_001098 [Pleopsidium flavum]|nr:MAG: hypothetical protein M1830_001098 [Pleopsidium flavum]